MPQATETLGLRSDEASTLPAGHYNIRSLTDPEGNFLVKRACQRGESPLLGRGPLRTLGKSNSTYDWSTPRARRVRKRIQVAEY